MVSRKFQTFVFQCMKSTLEDGVFFYCRFRIIQYSSFEQREWRNSYEWISNCINWYCCTRCRLSSVWPMAAPKNGGLIQKQKHRPTPKKTDRIMCHLPSSPYFRTSFHRLQVPALSRVQSLLPYSAGYRFFCG